MSTDDRSIVSWFAFAAAIAALVVAILGVQRDESESAAGGGGVERPTIEVIMNDFSFSPATITIPTSGATLRLVNQGSQVHNLQVNELDLVSEVVAPGTSADYEIGALSAGSYTVICPQPGHEAAGMVGTLVVGESSGDTTDHSASNQEMSWSQMDALMLKVAQQYPAKTVGKGGDLLEPTLAADGYKEFTLTAEIVDWEVEPGKIVQAWTYNGVVPAPTIHVYSGDKVRVILKNDLPQTTSLHLHGIAVPNTMDGVDPYTESPTKPGETHVYEFTAKGIAMGYPGVGIYHSHHNAQEQIPDGMFGAFLVDDVPIPAKLQAKGYTTIDKEVNMVLNDAGVIGLSLNGKSFPATEPYTLRVGQTMLVHYLNEGLTSHPMHLHQPTGWIVAKDGVPLDEPWPTDTVNVAPGERYSVLYMGMEPGVWAWHCHILTHAETPEGMRYMVTALIVER